MTLLFDENLSWRLIERLADTYPNSKYVKDFQLDHGSDDAVWRRAVSEGLAIVSKDDDFRQRALVFGAPPKTIWLKLGNASTDVIEQRLRDRFDDIRNFLAEPDEAMLILQAL